MQQALEFLLSHIEIVVFLTVLAEQIGLPIPAVPVLLAAGAVAAEGEAHLAVLTGLSVAACLLGDMVWFELGLHRGRQTLSLLCRIALEPDACVRRTENLFVRHGIRALILAKFIPGLSTLAPALAGLFKVSIGRFLLFNGAGSLLWSFLFLFLGYILSEQISYLAEQVMRLGKTAGILLAVILGGYVLYKYLHRQKLLRDLRVARISPSELKQLMDDGHSLSIVDLRGIEDHVADPYTIPGALRISAEELEQRHDDIPRDRDVILFCACPNEATSARMALMLRRKGVTRVRPLVGGIDAWRELAYPLEIDDSKVGVVVTTEIRT
ncbi:MAG: VTT domain-containing protein [Nitrospira sp.]|jgi:membrane protein DedA with SNARE-associated domain/rhodanese-related sulfurtransferase|nr:DedA family protein/thiosulfate sulfurtransferase GlpE [Nitrospira sp. BO4]